MPHALRHRTSVYNGYLRGPVTITHVAESRAVTTYSKDIRMSRMGFEHLSRARRTLLPTAPPLRLTFWYH